MRAGIIPPEDLGFYPLIRLKIKFIVGRKLKAQRSLQMKKGNFFVSGMFTLVLVALGLILVGCPNGTTEPYTGPKTIKITGYDSEPITAYIMTLQSEAEGTSSWSPTAYAIKKINGRTITYPLAIWDYPDWNDPKSERWTGTGKFFIIIECYPPKDSSRDGAKYGYSVDGINPTAVDIKSAVTTLKWSKFIWLYDYTGG
jgi:hypothetical protein